MLATMDNNTTNNTPTLESVLDNQSTDYFREFQAFLNQTFCNENLAFWIAVQQYQQHYPSGDEKACQKIIHQHIRSNAMQEINIPCDMRQDILHQVYHDQNYRPHIFDHAVDSILELMRANSFIPFLQQKQQQQQEQRNLKMDYPSHINKETTIQQRRSIGLFSNNTSNNHSNHHVLTSSISCPSIASHHSSSSTSFSSSSVLHRIKRTFLLGNVAVAAAAAAAKRRPSSMPTTPRTSGESNRRSWSPWRKRI